MRLIPHGQLLARKRLVVALDHRFLGAKPEMTVEPRVEPRPRDRVVIVRKMLAAVEHDVVRRAKHRVMVLQIGKSLGRHFLRPIVGRGHALRSGREERGKLDVARVHAQQRRVLAGAAALHRGAHHHGRKRKLDPRIDRGEQHGLRAAAAGAGDGRAFRIDLGQGEQEIEGADRIPSLQAHDALQPGLGLRAVETPVRRRVHLGPLPGKPVHDLARQLARIRVAQHVPLPDDAAHARELHAHRLKAAAPALFEALLPRGDLLPQFFRRFLQQPRVLPVAVPKHHRGDLALGILGPVQVARDEKAGGTFEINFFDGVLGPVDPPVDDRVERTLRRHRPKALRNENLPAHIVRALFPLRRRLRRGEGEIAVQILRRLEADIIRHRALREHPRAISEHGRNDEQGKEGEGNQRAGTFHGNEWSGGADGGTRLERTGLRKGGIA